MFFDEVILIKPKLALSELFLDIALVLSDF